MPTNLGALHAKALLFVVALVACSTTGVTTAASTPEGVIRRLHAAYTGNVSDALLSIKRNLRSDAIMTTTDDVNEREERAPVAPFFSTKDLEWAISEAGRVFMSLELSKKMDGDQLFKSKNFNYWIKIIKAYHPKEAYYAILAILSRHFGLDQQFGMSNFLMERLWHSKTWSRQAQKKISHRIAVELMKFQDQLWIREGKTPESVFDGLKIDKLIVNELKANELKANELEANELKANGLFKKPETVRWIQFVVTYEKREPYQTVDAILSSKIKAEDLAEALIEASSNTKWDYFASQLLKQQLKKWNEAKKTAMSVFDFLNPKKPFTERPMRLFISTWLDYIRDLGASDAQVLRVFQSKYNEEEIKEIFKKQIPNDPLERWKSPLERAKKMLTFNGVLTKELVKKIWGYEFVY